MPVPWGSFFLGQRVRASREGRQYPSSWADGACSPPTPGGSYLPAPPVNTPLLEAAFPDSCCLKFTRWKASLWPWPHRAGHIQCWPAPPG